MSSLGGSPAITALDFQKLKVISKEDEVMSYKPWFVFTAAALVLSSCGTSSLSPETSVNPRLSPQVAVDIPIVNTMTNTFLGGRVGATSAAVTIRAQKLSAFYANYPSPASILFCNRSLNPEEGVASVPSGCIREIVNAESLEPTQVTVYGSLPNAKRIMVYGVRHALYASFTAIDIEFW
jgi:hypothetical protein